MGVSCENEGTAAPAGGCELAAEGLAGCDDGALLGCEARGGADGLVGAPDALIGCELCGGGGDPDALVGAPDALIAGDDRSGAGGLLDARDAVIAGDADGLLGAPDALIAGDDRTGADGLLGAPDALIPCGGGSGADPPAALTG
ncbi:MAG: hypothetical protein ACJ790_12705 [Myxococcaceae bacterium]